MKIRNTFALASVSLLALSVPAFAQDAPADDSKAASDADIVVTGTLIRGTKVVGAQVIAVDSAAIRDLGANSTKEVLSLVPQIANAFNGRYEGSPRGFAGQNISIDRPNLRNLPGFNSASGGVTLVLLDGKRMAPVGVNQSAIDVNIIPASVLAGIDVITDGGTSLYGADAVAGVLNFRTMRKFDGLKVEGNFGFGDRIKGFHQWDGSITAGHSWNSGNAYISVAHAERDAILNKQVPWAASALAYDPAGVGKTVNTECNAPQQTVSRFVTVNHPVFGLLWTNNPGAAGAGPVSLGTGCDYTPENTYLPKQVTSNVFGALTQEFSDTVDLHVTAYWAKRDVTLYNYALGYTSAAGPIVGPVGRPTAAQVAAGAIFDAPQGVGFALGPNSSYVNRPSTVGLNTWGITPELTVKIGSSWAVRSSIHYGESNNYQSFRSLNGPQAETYIAAGTLNPLNIASASAAVINDITDFAKDQKTKQNLLMIRSIADGSLFALPAGDVKLAVGAEYQHVNYQTKLITGRAGAIDALPFQTANTSTYSVFGELSVPAATFLDLSASVRYDHYSNFGSTVNPNFGLTLKPTSWLKLYGHWNTSFNAPTAADLLAIATGRSGTNYTAGTPCGTGRPTDTAACLRDDGVGTRFIVLQGSGKNLKPQTATSWAVGFDATPTNNLRFGGQYYSIDFNNVLGSIDSQQASSYVSNPELFYYHKELGLASTASDALSGETVLQYLLRTQIVNGTQADLNSPTTSLANLAFIADLRTTNLAKARLEGLDFHVNYDTDASIGHIAFGLSGNYVTKSTFTSGGLSFNRITDAPRLNASTFLGWSNDGISAKVTVNYSGKFTDPSRNNISSTSFSKITPFVQTNLSLGYSFGEASGVLNGTSLRLNVDNLFNVKPQLVLRANQNADPYVNWTLGRVIKLGFSKQF